MFSNFWKIVYKIVTKMTVLAPGSSHGVRQHGTDGQNPEVNGDGFGGRGNNKTNSITMKAEVSSCQLHIFND